MYSYLTYTLRHKKAFLKLEKELLGKNTIRGYLHDMDKVLLYVLFIFIKSKNLKERIQKFHKKYSRHHKKARTYNDNVQTVIDWECSRFTKFDKPYNAYEYLIQRRPEKIKDLLPIIEKFGLKNEQI